MSNLFRKPLDQVNEQDLLRLIDSQLDENAYLEFKADWKSEYCKEIAAFANTDGGLLIVGIGENDNHVATNVTGIPELNGRTRYEESIHQTISSAFQPKMMYSVYPVKLESGNYVFVIEVPESSNKPHMFEKRYFVRHGSSSQPADHYEVRNMFDSARSQYESVKEFLTKRRLWDFDEFDFAEHDDYRFKKVRVLDKLVDIGESSCPKLILTYLPTRINSRFIRTSHLSVRKWIEQNNKGHKPLEKLSLIPHYGFEGRTVQIQRFPDKISYIIFSVNESLLTPISKINFLNNGVVEFVVSRLIFHTQSGKVSISQLVAYTEAVTRFVKRYFEAHGNISLEFLQVSLVNLQNTSLLESQNNTYQEPTRFVNNYLFRLPIENLNDYDSESAANELRYEVASQTTLCFGVDSAICVSDSGEYLFGIPHVRTNIKNLNTEMF